MVVRGDAAAPAGVSMKGGTLLIGGNCGYMAGFMMQKGRLVVCGDAGEALADSMYEGIVFVGGQIASLGNDTVIEEPTLEERTWLNELLATYRVPGPDSFSQGRVGAETMELRSEGTSLVESGPVKGGRYHILENPTMGRVLVPAKIENLNDLHEVSVGRLKPDEVRHIEVLDAIVDTGTMLLMLPRRFVEQLGLEAVSECAGREPAEA